MKLATSLRATLKELSLVLFLSVVVPLAVVFVLAVFVLTAFSPEYRTREDGTLAKTYHVTVLLPTLIKVEKKTFPVSTWGPLCKESSVFQSVYCPPADFQPKVTDPEARQALYEKQVLLPFLLNEYDVVRRQDGHWEFVRPAHYEIQPHVVRLFQVTPFI